MLEVRFSLEPRVDLAPNQVRHALRWLIAVHGVFGDEYSVHELEANILAVVVP